jgi:hypothetical protein
MIKNQNREPSKKYQSVTTHLNRSLLSLHGRRRHGGRNRGRDLLDIQPCLHMLRALSKP